MRINSINTIRHTSLRTKNQNHLNNNQILFKGRTVPATPVRAGGEWREYEPPIIGYEVPKNATPNYQGAYPNENTRVYIADPFEIITEEIYKTHDYTVRDDLWLSQIKKDYRTKYHGFSKNAEREIGYLEGQKEKTCQKIEFDKKRKEEFSERLRYANEQNLDEKTKKAIIQKINDYQKGVEYNKNQVKKLEQSLKTAQERYALLKKLDDKALEKDELDSKYRNIYQCNNDEIKKELYFLGLEKDEIVKDIEKLYKEKYPDWL